MYITLDIHVDMHIPSFLELILPVSQNVGSNNIRLVHSIQVSKIIVTQRMSPTIQKLTSLPPPRDTREKVSIFFWARSSLKFVHM